MGCEAQVVGTQIGRENVRGSVRPAGEISAVEMSRDIVW